MTNYSSLNPLARREWKKDEQHGPTFHQQIAELHSLRKRAAKLDPQGQQQLVWQMNELIRSHENPLLRSAATGVLGEIGTPDALAGLQLALDDEDPDVRIAACRAWGRQSGNADAVAALSRLASGDADTDVQMAAVEQLGNFSDPAAIQALGLALDDRDPALQLRAVRSLRSASGQNLGDNVAAWRAYVRGEPLPPDATPSLVQRLQNLF